MRIIINPLINFCCIWTNPAAETKSIGLRAYAQLSWFLHATLTTLSWHDKSCLFIGTWYRQDKLPWPNTFHHLPGLAKTTLPRRHAEAWQAPGT